MTQQGVMQQDQQDDMAAWEAANDRRMMDFIEPALREATREELMARASASQDIIESEAQVLRFCLKKAMCLDLEVAR